PISPYFLFLLIVLLPPRSPLFPYTTLFRSLGGRPGGPRPVARRRGSPRRRRPGDGRLLQRHAPAGQGGRRPGLQPGGADPRRAEIGRGTRLNSSHLGISYAVFCLKKKNII